MPDFETGTNATRDDLLQRVALLEAMIAEGQQSTMRYGWIFVAWGLCYIVAILWGSLGPHRFWAWPVCLTITILGVNIGRRRQLVASGGTVTARSHTLNAVWLAFGLGISLFCGSVAASHHFDDLMFISALCFFLGTVNITSAAIYRWKVQGLAGAIWWAAGIFALFATPNGAGIAFLVATFLSQIVFGLYLMALERRRTIVSPQRHASAS